MDIAVKKYDRTKIIFSGKEGGREGGYKYAPSSDGNSMTGQQPVVADGSDIKIVESLAEDQHYHSIPFTLPRI